VRAIQVCTTLMEKISNRVRKSEPGKFKNHRSGSIALVITPIGEESDNSATECETTQSDYSKTDCTQPSKAHLACIITQCVLLKAYKPDQSAIVNHHNVSHE